MKQNDNQSSYAFQSHKDVAFNANGIRRQRYELRKQLQSVKIDMALFSDTYLKPHERFPLQNYHFYRANRFRVEKIELPKQLENEFHTSFQYLPPLVSVQATGVCIPIGNNEALLAAVYKSPRRVWSDANIIELLGVRKKAVLAGDLNAKNPSCEKLLELFDGN
jgi:hypothetical protein